MTNDPTAKTLAELGVADARGVARLFAEVRTQFAAELDAKQNANQWEELRVSWLARKSGVLTRITDNWLKPAKPELKRAVGQALNELKPYIETTLETHRAAIENTTDHSLLPGESEDLSLPGVIRPLGSRHPLRQTFEEIERIFLSLGYSVVAGPEIETPYYNFEALNIPEHHPARDNMDTFYMATPPFTEGVHGKPGAESLLLRTHTSPMQIRTMEKQQPPVRIIVPGKVYRRDNPDATHGFMFHQIEGLAVDTDITFCDFKGTVDYFVREFLGPNIKTRLRPSYFPFTEPSVEVDATCVFCGGKGLQCLQAIGLDRVVWRERGVDPAVYGFVNYDARRRTVPWFPDAGATCSAAICLHCDFKGTVDYFVREFLRTQYQDLTQAELFPVHRAFRRSGRDLRILRRQGLQCLQAIGLDRVVWRGHGGPGRLRFRELRCEARLRLCFRPGRRAPDAAQIQHQRFAALFSERRSMFAAVPVGDYAKRDGDPCRAKLRVGSRAH